MSILSTIGKRLQTDIADNYAAILSPDFAKQMVANQFENRRLDRAEKTWLKRHELQRMEKKADLEEANSYKVQMGVLGEAFKKAQGTGDFSGITNIGDNPKFREDVREFARLYAPEFSGGLSWESMKQRVEWGKDARKQSLAEQKFNLENAKFANEQQEYLTDLYFKQYEGYIKGLESKKKEFGDSRNIVGIQQFFNNPNSDPEMTPAQREKYKGLVNEPGVTWEYVQDRYNEYVNEQAAIKVDAGKTARNEATIKAETYAGASKGEKEWAQALLIHRCKHSPDILGSPFKKNRMGK